MTTNQEDLLGPFFLKRHFVKPSWVFKHHFKNEWKINFSIALIKDKFVFDYFKDNVYR